MSFTRSSALTFFNWRTRMETSCGFSVSSKSIKRLTSGILPLGAATMRRLEVLSGQMRTWTAVWEPAADGAGEGGEGSEVTTGCGGPPKGEGPSLIDEELVLREDEDDE